MNNMKVFEFLAFLDETRNANGQIVDEVVEVKGPTTIFAKDQIQATTLATRMIPDGVFKDQGQFDRLVVVVRPF